MRKEESRFTARFGATVASRTPDGRSTVATQTSDGRSTVAPRTHENSPQAKLMTRLLREKMNKKLIPTVHVFIFCEFSFREIAFIDSKPTLILNHFST